MKLSDRLRALGELLERDHLIVAHIENFKHWPANAHVIDDVYEAALLVEESEQTVDEKDARR